jgi:hypothetical protein
VSPGKTFALADIPSAPSSRRLRASGRRQPAKRGRLPSTSRTRSDPGRQGQAARFTRQSLTPCSFLPSRRRPPTNVAPGRGRTRSDRATPGAWWSRVAVSKSTAVRAPVDCRLSTVDSELRSSCSLDQCVRTRRPSVLYHTSMGVCKGNEGGYLTRSQRQSSVPVGERGPGAPRPPIGPGTLWVPICARLRPCGPWEGTGPSPTMDGERRVDITQPPAAVRRGSRGPSRRASRRGR